MRKTLGLAALMVALGGGDSLPAQQQQAFDFHPQPRWAEEQETDAICAAISAECGAALVDSQIVADWEYREIYDSNLRLIGVHSTRSTGCKPLDEHLLLEQRAWVRKFAPGPDRDLDSDFTLEFRDGAARTGFRLVRHSSTQVTMTC